MKSAFAVIFLIVTFYSTSNSYAQKILYSEYDKFDFKDGEYSVVGMTGGLLYNYRTFGNEYFLDSYDDSMNKIATVILDFFPRRIYQVRFISYPEKIIVLYQASESNKIVQYAAVLDEKGRLKSKPIELGSVKTGIFGATKTYFSSSVSENKKMILVYSADDKSDQVTIDAKWLNDSLKVIKKSHAVFTAANSVEHGEVNVANDGTVYAAAYSPQGADNYADQYWILKLPVGATKFEPLELKLGGKFATSGYMKIDQLNNKIYFGGFYSDHKSGNYDGIIYACYDMTINSFQNTKMIPLDKESIFATGAKHSNHPFDNYEVRQIIVKKDGGFVLIAEVHYVTVRNTFSPRLGYYSYYSPYTTSTIKEYHYNDLMALSYDKDGQRTWSTFIPKEQYSQEDGGMFSSYTLLNSGGTLAFLYNDFDRNHSRIQMATVSSEGKTTVRAFEPDGNDNPDWIPKAGKQVGSRTVIIPCLRKRQVCFAKVEF
jgi:hypothetical protein